MPLTAVAMLFDTVLSAAMSFDAVLSDSMLSEFQSGGFRGNESVLRLAINNAQRCDKFNCI